MSNKEIAEFAKILVQQVRDATIQNCDRRLRPDAADPVAKRWRTLDNNADLESVAKVLIPDIVDSTLSHLLRAIDQEVLRLVFVASNRKEVNLCQDGLGELSGWYMGSDGWRRMFSQERFVDDFSDLK